MPDDALVQQVTETTLRLISASRSGEVDGDEVVRAIGRDDLEDIDFYYAFREAVRRGSFAARGWHGGMGLPYMLHLP